MSQYNMREKKVSTFMSKQTPCYQKNAVRSTNVYLFFLVLIFTNSTTTFSAPFPNEPLTKGVFLIASAHLKGSSFEKTVIFLTQYSKYGAMGIAINRPSRLKISDAFPSLKSTKAREQLYLGGPVHPKSVLVLIKSTNSQTIPAIIEDVYVSGGHQTQKYLTEAEENNDVVRVYAGYAGWSPGQLEAEIQRGDWFITKADTSFIFEKETTDLWQRLTKSESGQWI